MQIGFLMRTPRGRIATENAYRHLGIPYAQASKDIRQATLFDEKKD